VPRDPHRSAFKPRNIAVAGRDLALAWGDGHESYYPFDDLRRNCPCAQCRAAARRDVASAGLRIVDAPRVGALEIRALRPVGAYAVQIVWSDGHDTGIHAFEDLRRACPCAPCRARFVCG
jgi:DUF971 family protein